MVEAWKKTKKCKKSTREAKGIRICCLYVRIRRRTNKRRGEETRKDGRRGVMSCTKESD